MKYWCNLPILNSMLRGLFRVLAMISVRGVWPDRCDLRDQHSWALVDPCASTLCVFEAARMSFCWLNAKLETEGQSFNVENISSFSLRPIILSIWTIGAVFSVRRVEFKVFSFHTHLHHVHLVCNQDTHVQQVHRQSAFSPLQCFKFMSLQLSELQKDSPFGKKTGFVHNIHEDTMKAASAHCFAWSWDLAIPGCLKSCPSRFVVLYFNQMGSFSLWKPEKLHKAQEREREEKGIRLTNVQEKEGTSLNPRNPMFFVWCDYADMEGVHGAFDAMPKLHHQLNPGHTGPMKRYQLSIFS